MLPVIRSLRRYLGQVHPTVYGEPVIVVAVHRFPQTGELILLDDADIGPLDPADLVEFVPILIAPDGTQHASQINSHAFPIELGPPEGMWEGRIGRPIIV